ncbi:lytic transglycosylase domain-containing protein [Azospirillum aestuarii]|uniref:lytic transglycosylase domain-containing protein n=1 Tax=Azospirillum aestuarii TaxID=2802052 RepID=UPI00190AF8AC|nr:lytic transglycosylase domain-containing protein [Azospirillum brasilense]
MRRLAGLAALLLAGTATAADVKPPASQIGTWSTALYAPRVLPARSSLPPEAACIDAILAAEREAGVTDHMLLAMGFTEAGRMTADRLFTVWPWTVNTEGASRYFPTREEAIAFVRAAQARGTRSIDVGCLQVNLKWHPDAFPDLETAFDPRANARYAARFLGDLHRAQGSLDAAIARYHSAQSERGTAYRERVGGNRRWVAGAMNYLKALAAGPQTAGPQAAPGALPAWGRAELGRLSFLSSLYANAAVRPLLPAAE